MFKELYKTIKEFISNNVAEPFYLKRTQRTLGLQKGAQVALKKHLSTPKALQGHWRTQSTRALKTFGQSDTWRTRVLEGHLGTLSIQDTSFSILTRNRRNMWNLTKIMYETGKAVTKLCTDKKKQKQNIRKKPCWKENHTERNFIIL